VRKEDEAKKAVADADFVPKPQIVRTAFFLMDASFAGRARRLRAAGLRSRFLDRPDASGFVHGSSFAQGLSR
jgi:hypothetical protein